MFESGIQQVFQLTVEDYCLGHVDNDHKHQIESQNDVGAAD